MLIEGIFPIKRYKNKILKEISKETKKRIKLLANRKGELIYFRSEKNIAKLIEDKRQLYIVISDSLIKQTYKYIQVIFNDDRMHSLFAEIFEIEYTNIDLSIDSKNTLNHSINTKNEKSENIFITILMNAIVYIILHEISHSLGDYTDKTAAHLISQILNQHEQKENYEEYRADGEAGWWLANRTKDEIAEANPSGIQISELFFDFCLSFLGMHISIIINSFSDEFNKFETKLHPSFETRIESAGNEFKVIFDQLVNEQHKFIALQGLTEIKNCVEKILFGKSSKYIIRFP